VKGSRELKSFLKKSKEEAGCLKNYKRGPASLVAEIHLLPIPDGMFTDNGHEREKDREVLFRKKPAKADAGIKNKKEIRTGASGVSAGSPGNIPACPRSA
jgi:hypothetical protein